jgi:hypothetical protein
LAKKKRLLILGPSYRRRKSSDLLPAIERYDGLFFRVARKYLNDVTDVDTVVMTDNLVVVDGSRSMPYCEPEGNKWGGKRISKNDAGRAKSDNERYFEKKLEGGKYSEIFISMGKDYAAALPDLSNCGIKVLFPASGGPGPKAQALKQWFNAR